MFDGAVSAVCHLCVAVIRAPWVGGRGQRNGETMQCKFVEEENLSASTTRCSTRPGAFKLHNNVDCLALMNGIKARGVQEAPLRPSEWPVRQEKTVQVTSIAMNL